MENRFNFKKAFKVQNPCIHHVLYLSFKSSLITNVDGLNMLVVKGWLAYWNYASLILGLIKLGKVRIAKAWLGWI